MKLAVLGEKITTLCKRPAQTKLESLPSIGSICRSCQYDEEKTPSTTARLRSGRNQKNLVQLEKSAQEGCWICKALLSAMSLWTTVNPEELKRLSQAYVRYDVEMFILCGPATLPRLQLYSPKGMEILLCHSKAVRVPGKKAYSMNRRSSGIEVHR
jgi:hypothetical protein